MRGGSAPSHSPRVLLGAKRGLATVGVGEIEKVEMGVWLNATGDDYLAGSIYRSSGLHPVIVDADINNPLTVDTKRPFTDALGSYDLAIFYEPCCAVTFPNCLFQFPPCRHAQSPRHRLHHPTAPLP